MAKTDASACIIFSFLGLIASAATAYIYKFVYRAKTVEEKCIIHLSASLALTEFLIFIHFASGNDDIYSYRVSETAVVVNTFALSAFLWSLMLVFHMKKKFTSRRTETSMHLESTFSNESVLMDKYLLIGYGVPFLVSTCYMGGLDYYARKSIVASTVYAEVAIILLNSLIFHNLLKNLSHQIDNAELSFKSNTS